MSKRLIHYLLLGCCLHFANGASGQVSISGATCVLPGTVYEYRISANWDSSSVMQVCVNGGSIVDTSISGSCTSNNFPVNAVLISWNDLPQASFTVTSSLGNSTFSVSSMAPLSAGLIDSLSKQQNLFDTVSIPAAIVCNGDSGGSCSPVYSYQWQRSDDAMIWQDLPEDTSKNLVFTQAATQTYYYRRKITETISTSIGFSDIAIVNVIVPAASN
jgi:hypothetical protein